MAGGQPRRVLIYSGDMFNDLDDVPYVITMEIVDRPEPLEITSPDGLRIAYTRLDHVPKRTLREQVAELPREVMETLNTRLFMVIATG
ncbi:hypothetical protein [Amycolatopsis anabasis]|uniref:hypothetical protein n=1 Tax=Amycolatopsis anabasis TaxID=1840409 RepID=UPI00131E774E|nr:hypothetical protein [Amycolatopsis anabasis]